MPSGQTIPVLERSVALLERIAAQPEGLGAKHLSLELGIPPATCYRILRTLVKHGWLQENGGGAYRIAFGLARLTRSWSALEQRLRDVRPRLQQLSRDTGLSAKISLREGGQAVSVARVESLRANSISSPVGTKIHLTEAGSAGIQLMASVPPAELRSILRELPPERQRTTFRAVAAARREGIARSYGAHHASIYAVSVPLDLGQPAALTLVGWPEDFAGRRRKDIEVRLRNVELRMETDFRGSVFGEETPAFLPD